jgi:hypothetical protein
MSNQEAEFYSRSMEKYRDENIGLREEILYLKNKLKIAEQALRFIRSGCDCRNESEAEQCANVAEDAIREIREAR